MRRQRIHVAVGVVHGDDGQILISRRPETLHQGGLWEFPGGKVEAGEGVGPALVRELREELGISATPERCILRIPFDYDDRSVLLDVWHCRHIGGQPRALEVADWRWVVPERLGEYRFPAANRPILDAVRLPSRYLITPSDEPIGELIEGLDDALAAGIRLVQWRRPADEVDTLRRALRRCHKAGARLLVNEDVTLASQVGADGVHLRSPQLSELTGRPWPRPALVAASCHDPAELERALALDVDFVVLSPVAATASHPGAEPLGWGRFGDWIHDYPRPVYALGGMSEVELPRALAARAQGIAAIRGLWPGR
ncbi:MAG: Nudix family hydrolase [Arhodomonas sp.]|nr:Nudix family hydrolase [Arhodomonas sp.]